MADPRRNTKQLARHYFIANDGRRGFIEGAVGANRVLVRLHPEPAKSVVTIEDLTGCRLYREWSDWFDAWFDPSESGMATSR